MNIFSSLVGLGVLTYPNSMKYNSISIILLVVFWIFWLIYIPTKYIDRLANRFQINGPRIELLFEKIFGNFGLYFVMILIVFTKMSVFTVFIIFG